LEQKIYHIPEYHDDTSDRLGVVFVEPAPADGTGKAAFSVDRAFSRTEKADALKNLKTKQRGSFAALARDLSLSPPAPTPLKHDLIFLSTFSVEEKKRNSFKKEKNLLTFILFPF
jgi:hypothetical protein